METHLPVNPNENIKKKDMHDIVSIDIFRQNDMCFKMDKKDQMYQTNIVKWVIPQLDGNIEISDEEQGDSSNDQEINTVLPETQKDSSSLKQSLGEDVLQLHIENDKVLYQDYVKFDQCSIAKLDDYGRGKYMQPRYLDYQIDQLDGNTDDIHYEGKNRSIRYLCDQL